MFGTSGKILTLELQGLSLTVGSLERQLLDREESYERLKRQLDAKGDRSEREKDLARQVRSAYIFFCYTELPQVELKLQRGCVLMSIHMIPYFPLLLYSMLQTIACVM